ncbi:MAG: GntR family transcriptional regulator [Microbacterium sp.]|uniref:GntR family transcriptional regulator n=2 Tax=Bacillati TaxID=1783272 RepID=A0A3C1KDW2_9MICO|nr:MULTISPECIES: GntR family transcriptional regulator [unclassified Microbacterium]MAL06642.1 GntR family transcriptional regulator [Microbacterium sp.]MBN9198792.1 GntR family transcriptional regulator [Microbacterium ginsengisoli]MCK9916659.1 GntR family transcriptional regulator [Microbacteriaceae bacterium K1510]KQS02622.1 GntR family transcriptional regulator [Microbacterium sp. Leaf347]KQS05988.1 GntR family transcriptional regulator [Microbacterium sp. Leaf351]
MDETRPIFVQVAEQIENQILAGLLAEDAQIPSTNELAGFLRINPATALKGVNMLVDAGIVEKRRGIGMFVTSGARERVAGRRRRSFADEFVRPLIVEASTLGIEADQLIDLVRAECAAAANTDVRIAS